MIANGLYITIVFLISQSENSLGALYDIKPVNSISSLEYEYKMMQILLEVKTEVASLKKEIKELNERKHDEIKTNNSVSITKNENTVMKTLLEMKSDMATQAKEINDLKQRTHNGQKVAFMAQLSKILLNPPRNSVVKFDSVLTNVGNGYKPDQGSFVAPVDGTYAINLIASSNRKKTSEYLWLYIMQNVKQVGYIFLDSNSDRSLLRSTAIVVQLRAGDKLYVKIGNNHPRGDLVGPGFHTMFSGFLVN